MLDPHGALQEELGDRYDFEDVLGEGGMGTVYLARDRKHDRHVAIKTIRPDLTTDAGRRRFEREITITAGLQHPHILPLLDSGVAGETLYYVMPYVEGESVRARLTRQGKLPIDEVVRIGRDVASGLATAHKQGVIHRDIKPENILLTGGHAMIVDFGIAKALVETDREQLTQAGGVLGSLNYMAPEQIGGVVTEKSDLYSLGLVLYEAATGHMWDETVDPDWTGVPAQIRGVIERALDRVPRERWADAAEFRRALKPGGAPQARRLAAIGAAAAVLLTAGAWWTATNLGGGRAVGFNDDARGSIAVLPLENLNRDAASR
jgi:serine/threonine-protein kinase